MLRYVLIITLAFSFRLCLVEQARAEMPLYEQEPFDLITLDKENGNSVLKVKPLDLPERRVPAKPIPGDTVVIRLLDQPDKKYEVAWESIKKVEFFEQKLLDKAKELLGAGKRDQAHDYFRFLEQNYPRMDGLAAAVEECLFTEAKEFHAQRQYRNALALLRELHRRNPNRPQLDKQMGAMTEKLVAQYAANSDYRSVRMLLRTLAACYPNHPLIEQWETKLRVEAAAILPDARAAEQSGDLRKAAALSRRILQLWPALEGAKELAESLHQKYPRVVVGVCEAAPDMCRGRPGNDAGLLTDWATRRTTRLVFRTLTEFVGANASGGQYRCPVGAVKVKSDGRKITVSLNPDLRWSAGEATLSGYDVSRRLLALADPADAAFRSDWAGLFNRVAVQNVYQVDIELLRNHLRPEAMLQTILPPYTASRASESERLPFNGPFAYADEAGDETTYLLNARYSAGAPTQSKELVERRFADGAAAVRALRRGDIQVLDRVNPWQVKSLRADTNLVVRPYALPLVHCLIPNARKPLMSIRAFRRALACGIDCQAILNRILRGDRLADCVVLHGPFPVGALSKRSDDAPDSEITPWPFDPRLAIVLAEASRSEQTDEGKKERAGPSLACRVVLAHPPSEIARTACTAIRRQLAEIGVAVELKELPTAATAPIPADVDLLYTELAMWEPLVDAPRTLGENGLAGACSPRMGEALRQLEQAKDWGEVAARLRRIDRIAHDEVAVVPLWQLVDYFAYRANLEGFKPQTMTLYQDVERWKAAFQFPRDD